MSASETQSTVTQLNDVTAKVTAANDTLANLQQSFTTQKTIQWISLALAILGFAAAAILFLRRKK